MSQNWDQRIIDDISDLLQGRDSEHREYPFGHPKFRPPAGSLLPSSSVSYSVNVAFDSEEECIRFAEIFKTLSGDARARTIRHLEEIGNVESQGKVPNE